MKPKSARVEPAPPSAEQWGYSVFLTFLLGGFLGAAVNLAATWGFLSFLSWNPLWAFGAGTFLNQAFHYFYYYAVNANREIHLRTPLPLHLSLMLGVSTAASVLLWFFLARVGLSLPQGLLASLFLLAASNTLLSRVATFSSARLAQVEYREMGESFYDDQTDGSKVGGFRAWYHRSRYERLAALVSGHFRKGFRMVDLGCGNCRWNLQGLPVTGVDINAPMLRWAKKNGRLKETRVCDNLARTGLPSKSFDIVLMSEVLEHVSNLDGTIREVRRVLKDRGVFLLTVPYDFFLGPFFILFNLNCLYRGFIRGSRYHRYRCGHIHHFTQGRLRAALANNGFELRKVFVVNGLLLYGVAVKSSLPQGKVA